LDAERRKVEALREALTKAADTFADYSKVLKLIGKDVLMQGCDIAEQAARAAEVEDLRDMVRWAYGKLHHVNYSNQEDALMLDRMKLLLEHGVMA
jgi:hypothetical protein